MNSRSQTKHKETQLSFDLTLSDLVKKHIGEKSKGGPKSAEDKEMPKEIQQLIPSLKPKESARLLATKETAQKKSDISLEGALSRWKVAIEWREANKERLMQGAAALYKISS